MVRQLVGMVTEKRVGGRSKGARLAIVLRARDGGEFVLRRVGGHPLRDPDLKKLVGKTIRATGRQTEYDFVMSDWDEIED